MNFHRAKRLMFLICNNSFESISQFRKILETFDNCHSTIIIAGNEDIMHSISILLHRTYETIKDEPAEKK